MRGLTLTKDVLAELRTDELVLVVGAQATTPAGACLAGLTAEVADLTSRLVECDSLLRPCITSTCER